MKKAFLLSLTLTMLVLISQKSTAQDTTTDTSATDTTLYDDRTPSNGHDLRLPQSLLSTLEYSNFINKAFTASPVLRKNRVYTKVEITEVIEKDGTVSAYSVKGTGPETMKAELVRILKRLPNYKPGTRDGKAARFRQYQPFEFEYN